MSAPFARKTRGADTHYFQFAKVRSARSTDDGDAVTDVNTGASPVTRWLTYVISYDDVVSNSAGTDWVVNCLIPRNTLIMDAMVRLDQVFDGNGANSVEVGDANQESGWAAAIDLTTSVTSGPVYFRDANAVYTDKTSDISQGSTGAQYYKEGGQVIVTLATTVPTQGRAVLLLATPSYNEPQNSEWTA